MHPSPGPGPGDMGFPSEHMGFPAEHMGYPTDPAQMQQLVELLGGGGAPKSTAVVECPKTMVGRVIGKGGETIKALQQYTGAMIQIDQSSDPTRVTIAGLPQALHLAMSMINDIVRGTFKGFAMLRQIAVTNAAAPGTAAHGAAHAPVYVQGYGFVPPSQVYQPGADDPLASLLRGSPPSHATPPLSPMHPGPEAGVTGYPPELAAMLLRGRMPAGFVPGGQGHMPPPPMHPSNMSPMQHPDSDVVLSQLLNQLSLNHQAAAAAEALQQHSPQSYAGPAQGLVTPPGTPSAGSVLDAAGLQTLLAQAALMGRGTGPASAHSVSSGPPHAGSASSLGGGGGRGEGARGGPPQPAQRLPGREGSASGLAAYLAKLSQVNVPSAALAGAASGSPASSSPLTAYLGSGRASPSGGVDLPPGRLRARTDPGSIATRAAEDAAGAGPPSPLGEAAPRTSTRMRSPGGSFTQV